MAFARFRRIDWKATQVYSFRTQNSVTPDTEHRRFTAASPDAPTNHRRLSATWLRAALQESIRCFSNRIPESWGLHYETASASSAISPGVGRWCSSTNARP